MPEFSAEEPVRRVSIEHDSARRDTRLVMGRKLKTIRESRGLTLRAAASVSGLSPSFIRLVENGETEIAVSRLISLADAYEIEFTELLPSRRRELFDYVAFAQMSKLDTGVPGVDVYHMPGKAWPIQPFIVHLQPGSEMKGLRHDQEEFLHCVQGEPRIGVGTTATKMEPGDTVWVRTLAEHDYINDSDSLAVIVGAYSRRETPSADGL